AERAVPFPEHLVGQHQGPFRGNWTFLSQRSGKNTSPCPPAIPSPSFLAEVLHMGPRRPPAEAQSSPSGNGQQLDATRGPATGEQRPGEEYSHRAQERVSHHGHLHQPRREQPSAEFRIAGGRRIKDAFLINLENQQTRHCLI
ncbi:hypothetical protein H1C71_001681, partial [Ictidomys tridecemlineatus]